MPTPIVSPPNQSVVTATLVAGATPADSASSDSANLLHRPRRLRKSAGLRRMVRETVLSTADMILTYFAKDAALLLAENKSSGGSK